MAAADRRDRPLPAGPAAGHRRAARAARRPAARRRLRARRRGVAPLRALRRGARRRRGRGGAREGRRARCRRRSRRSRSRAAPVRGRLLRRGRLARRDRARPRSGCLRPRARAGPAPRREGVPRDAERPLPRLSEDAPVQGPLSADLERSSGLAGWAHPLLHEPRSRGAPAGIGVPGSGAARLGRAIHPRDAPLPAARTAARSAARARVPDGGQLRRGDAVAGRRAGARAAGTRRRARTSSSAAPLSPSRSS